MLSSLPIVSTYSKFNDTGSSIQTQKLAGNGFLRSNNDKINLSDSVSFKGWSPDPQNAKDIYKIIKLLKSSGVKRMALFAHYEPDGDAIGSMMALKRMIEQSKSKKVDVFTLKPLHPSFRLLDPENEIKVLSDVFAEKIEREKISVEDITPQEIREKFGDYDLAIALDTPEKITIDKQFSHLLSYAKHIVKIDHHALPLGADRHMFNYGEVNLIDATKESATLLVMQFAKPFGLKINESISSIADALSFGLVTDTAQFEFSKRRPKPQFTWLKGIEQSKAAALLAKLAHSLGLKESKLPTMFDDLADLEKVSDIKKVIQNAFILTPDELKTYGLIAAKKIQFSQDGEVGYFSVDSNELPAATKFVTRPLVQKLIKVHGLKYIFAVSRITKNSEDINLAVIESKDKSIKGIIDEFHGVGHHSYGAIELRGMSVEDAEKLIMDKIEQVRQS